MEKLMKYVEEMQKEWINICRPRFQEYYLVDMMLISKYYWLIKWLVDNDKIDFSRDWKYCEKSIEEFDWLFRADEDSLIMILAIQDKPIDFLLDILK